jgi:peptide/nickel transport system permease protein
MVITTVALSISFLVYVIVGQYVFAFSSAGSRCRAGRLGLAQPLTYVPCPVLLGDGGAGAADSPVPSFSSTSSARLRAHRAQSMTENRALFVHVLRNAMIPVLTNIAVQLPSIFLGSFLIETFFSVPGLGRETLLAVNRSDYPVIQAVTVYLAVLTMLINLGADMLYKWVDPRVVLK